MTRNDHRINENILDYLSQSHAKVFPTVQKRGKYAQKHESDRAREKLSPYRTG